MSSSPPRRATRFNVEALESREVLSGFHTAAPAYLTPVAPGVQFTPLVTVGDSVNGYQMVGIPDGTGAFDNGDGTFTVLMNHELPATSGAVRAHGQRGSFVSKWVIDKATLGVLSGADLIQDVVQVTGTDAIGRLCSADLPAATAFLNAATGLGTPERIFMNGEEVGAEGRGFGTVVSTGTAFELPRLGKSSWENSVASPFAQDRTIVVEMDDNTPGQVYVYIGTKTAAGTPIERAGLTNGNLFGIKVDVLTSESRDFGLATAGPGLTTSAHFTMFNHGDVSGLTGAALNTASNAAGVTNFLRPEDGAWDPSNPRDFYFVTTDRFDATATPGRSRLYRLRFDDITNPEAGGTVQMLLDGTDPGQMFDNITVDAEGHVLMQEDPGNQTHIAKVWQYDIATSDLTLVAQHNTALFAPGAPGFLTQDEESSGILDLSHILGRGYYLADVQAHYTNSNPDLVEGGQMLILSTDNPTATLTDGMLKVQGTIADDQIAVTRRGQTVTVAVGGTVRDTFAVKNIDTVRVDGGSGSDTINLGGNVHISAIATGAPGMTRSSVAAAGTC